MWIHGFLLTKLVLCLCVFSEMTLDCSARRKDKLQKSGMSGKNDISETKRRHSEKRNSPEIFSLNNLAEDNVDDEGYDVIGHEDNINLSTNNEEVEHARRKKIDPKGSWITFVKYSEDRTGEKGSDRRKKKRNRKHRRQTLHGPPGPVGPPGPPGPPGISFSKEEILADLQSLIKEEAEKRAKEIVAMRDGEANNIPLPVTEDMTSHLLSLPRIHSGFTMRLKSRETIQRKSLKELKFFQQPFGPGSFERGDTFNTEEGRFIVPRDGVYHFTASLRLKIRTKKKPKTLMKSSEHVEVSICIDSKCKTNTSIATITGINRHQTLFTATITGTLHLQEKQYTSVYVDNASSFNIIILAGSEYSGLFLGV